MKRQQEEYETLLGGDNGASSVDRVRRDRTIRNPDIDERLHRLHVLFGQQAKEFSDADEVHEAGIEVSPPRGVGTSAHMPKRVDPMRMV